MSRIQFNSENSELHVQYFKLNMLLQPDLIYTNIINLSSKMKVMVIIYRVK